eukprot:765035-Hanusia_phi.AAC.1
MSSSDRCTPGKDITANMKNVLEMTRLLEELNSARKQVSHKVNRINKECESIQGEMWDLCSQTSDVLDLIANETAATQQDIDKLEMYMMATEEKARKTHSALESQREYNDMHILDLTSKGECLQDSFYEKVLRISAFSKRRLMLHKVYRGWINVARMRNSLCTRENIVRRRNQYKALRDRLQGWRACIARPQISSIESHEQSFGRDLPSWEISRISMT